jgi:hypothetical protein
MNAEGETVREPQLKIPPCSNVICCGSSFSGKSYSVLNLLQHPEDAFLKPVVKIIWLYAYQQSYFKDLRDKYKDQIIFHEGWTNDFETKFDLSGRAGQKEFEDIVVLVIDDQGSEIGTNKTAEKLATSTTHHLGLAHFSYCKRCSQRGVAFKRLCEMHTYCFCMVG